jgi:serine/threonine protein phosphatase 1
LKELHRELSMDKKRTLIVGDVHGCFKELQELLEKVSYSKEEDRLIFVGDLINKGPSSMEVIEWVKAEGSEVVLGNHELGFLEYLEDSEDKIPSFELLISQMKGKEQEWGAWMKDFPLYIEEDDFIVVHGGVVPGKALKDSPAELLTRIRTWNFGKEGLGKEDHPGWYEFYHGEKVVIYGHWASEGLNIKENTIGLDSGCCWGNQLSLIHLETRKIHQVEAQEEYSEPD